MDFLNRWLLNAEKEGLCRELTPVSREVGRPISVAVREGFQSLFDFSSNDYLALSHHPALSAAALEALNKYGTGAGSARLMSGDLEIFHQLENETALLKGNEAALLFGSGYLANVGVIPALVGRGDTIFTDRLNHASIYDGCRLSGARLVRFRHNDIDHLETMLRKNSGAGRSLLIVESVYSMDGDICPLADLVALKNRFSTLLMVDEAHATGVFGSSGGGVISREGVEQDVDVAMGTYGKALGSYGAYVSGTALMIRFLLNRARSFVFTTALPPAVAAASLAAVRLVRNEPSRREKLFVKATCFKEALRNGGVSGIPGPSQIVPLMVGDNHQAVLLADECRRQGVFATAVRPPTVPAGEARLRFSVTLHHSHQDLIDTAGKIVSISEKLSIPLSF
ncbi:MAG: 8-amino-7-oxononanoate synthase [Proteobacteria bacterium]|nr:8-amino-7-oxononanoate synthase [Pseudomonadota bacterium]MBU1737544.1 8-amino-7-oxononanoate synthase [Pseudomonadota bacterium]